MKCKIFILALFIPVHIHGQDILDDYVRQGLDNNLALKQKQSGYEKSLEALREARSLFYPNISFNARYTISEGGRVIDFPVGDLLNPVYSTLNALTSSSLFPMIDNQQVRFLRPTEHETKLRISQPLFSPSIYYNSLIIKELSLAGEADLDQYRRELVAEIRKAYYNTAMANALVKMLTDTRKLLVENVRVNRKLMSNNKVTADYLFRSESELNKFDQELRDAQKDEKIAEAYFNFLLNRPLSDSIIIQDPAIFPVLSQITPGVRENALENREELRKLANYENISNMQLKMSQSGKLPNLFVVADYGFQGEEYKFNSESDYLQASAVLSWTLFEGFRNKARISQAMLQKEMAEQKLEEARKQIELQVTAALEEVSSSEKGIVSAESRLKNATESFRIIEKKYSEGQVSLIEFIDARTNLTQSEGNLIISRFRYLSAFAEFEKVAAINYTK
jgi:outer membrane protein